jgi:hypothetical protein
MSNPFVSSGPGPRLEDCAPIQQATPTGYVCGGKTFRSIQLTDITNGKQGRTYSVFLNMEFAY